MLTTNVSLLERLKRPSADDAWERFVRIYSPLLLHWSRQLGLQDQDAEDLVQDVLVLLVRKMPEFQYQPHQTFRGWMRTMLTNKWRDRPNRSAPVAVDYDLEIQALHNGDDIEEQEFRHYVIGKALQLMATDFELATWKACWETVVVGRPAADVAAELNITINAVYLAKSRVIRRLRHDLAGILD